MKQKEFMNLRPGTKFLCYGHEWRKLNHTQGHRLTGQRTTKQFAARTLVEKI